MIDRRTKNAEIFRDTERRYTTDQALVQVIRKSTESQAFIAEKSTVDVPAPSKTEKAKVIVSGKRSLEATENYAKQGKKVCVLELRICNQPRRWRCERLISARGMHLQMHHALSLPQHQLDVECVLQPTS